MILATLRIYEGLVFYTRGVWFFARGEACSMVTQRLIESRFYLNVTLQIMLLSRSSIQPISSSNIMQPSDELL